MCCLHINIKQNYWGRLWCTNTVNRIVASGICPMLGKRWRWHLVEMWYWDIKSSMQCWLKVTANLPIAKLRFVWTKLQLGVEIPTYPQITLTEFLSQISSQEGYHDVLLLIKDETKYEAARTTPSAPVTRFMWFHSFRKVIFSTVDATTTVSQLL